LQSLQTLLHTCKNSQCLRKILRNKMGRALRWLF